MSDEKKKISVAMTVDSESLELTKEAIRNAVEEDPPPTPVMSAVYIKKLCDNAIIPAKATAGAAGYDLYSACFATLRPGETKVVGTGVSIQLQGDLEAQVRSRSGLASRGIVVANSPGTIDSDYTGEVKVILRNESSENFEVKAGDRIAQMVIAYLPQFVLTEVSELPCETDRGDGGFGSTGT